MFGGVCFKLTSSWPPARVKWGWELRRLLHFGGILRSRGRVPRGHFLCAGCVLQSHSLGIGRPFWTQSHSKLPLGYLGGALGCPGLFSQICRKLDAQFRANVSILQCLRIESSLPELSTQSRGSPGTRGSRGSCIWTAARCPPSSRRGPG